LWEQVFEIDLKLCPGKEKVPNDPNPHFKEKEKGGEGRSKAWWPMEGSMLGGQWKVKENTFSPLPIFPPTNFT
jgi:hypothetical protein